MVLTPGTGAFDGTGMPVLCMPIGFGIESRTGRTVPHGVTLAAPPFGEERLLAIAAAWQARSDHHTVRPEDPVG